MSNPISSRGGFCVALAAGVALWAGQSAGQQPAPAAKPATTTPAAAAPMMRFYSPGPAVAPAPPPGVPPLPQWSPMPRTATSIPLSTDILPGAPPQLLVAPLAQYGYVEDEYLVSGAANVYTAGGKGVAKADVPYVTRILVRRPADVSKFSGTIVIEPMRDLTAWVTAWLEASPYMMRSGDVFVTFTMATDNVPMLVSRYDPQRYAAINISDDGLRWDIMAQVAGLVRSQDGPLAGQGYLDRAKQVKGGLKVYSIGTSLTGYMQLAFIDGGHHARARRADGGPIIDGYVPIIAGIPLDPPTDVPVIRVISESEYLNPNPTVTPPTWASRLPDSDGPGARVREYDVAGASHMGRLTEVRFMVPNYQMGNLDLGACLHEPSDLPSHAHVVSAALANLDNWVRNGVAPAPSALFELNPDHTLTRDAYGNVLGGVRNYWVAAPTANFRSDNKAAPGMGPAAPSTCPMLGYEVPLSDDVVHGLYKSRADYVAKADAAIDALAASRLILPEDAAAERAAVAKTAMP